MRDGSEKNKSQDKLLKATEQRTILVSVDPTTCLLCSRTSVERVIPRFLERESGQALLSLGVSVLGKRFAPG